MGNILGKVLHDVFDYVRDAFALEGGEAGKWSQQRDILRNEVAKRGGIFSAAAYAYFEGSIEIGDELTLVSSKLSESPFSNPKVKGKIGLGLYAGVRVEVSLWGYTGALEATITVEASGELVYNFGTNEGAFWHNGVGVIVTVLAEANLQKESNKCNRGSVSAKAGKEYRVKWCDAGSENNPLIHLAF